MENLTKLAIRAYSGTSFSPEKRGNDTAKWLSQELEADVLGMSPESSEKYRQKYLQHASRWLSRKGRVLSPMITGPSGFPVARNEKALNAEFKAWEDFQAWRSKWISRQNRERTKSPEEEIDDALAELDKAVLFQERAKITNKVIRGIGTPEEKIKLIQELTGWDERVSTKLMEPDCFGYLGVAPFSLTNNNAKIKRLRDKLTTMRRRIETRDSFETIEFEGGRITIEEDRVMVRHDVKPPREIIDRFKSNGFRWSPHWKCWCRKHTAQALRIAKELIKP